MKLCCFCSHFRIDAINGYAYSEDTVDPAASSLVCSKGLQHEREDSAIHQPLFLDWCQKANACSEYDPPQ